MKWFRDTFGEIELLKEGDGGLNAFDQLDLMAAEVAAGSDGLIALPHLQGSGRSLRRKTIRVRAAWEPGSWREWPAGSGIL